MKVGLVLPIADDDGAGTPSWSRILELARRAEVGGIDSLWVFDHLLFRFPKKPESGLHEAWTMLAALAATTERAELGTIVLATPFRPPAWTAKAIATADDISGGRLIVGLGAGWHEPEFTAFGYPFDHRVGRFEEALGIIRRLLDGERVTFEGRWHRIDDSVLLPPPRRAHIPILVASKGERMLRLTARHADAWNTAWFGVPDERWQSRFADLRAACDAEGRDLSTLEVTVGLSLDGSLQTARPGAPNALPADVQAIADAFAAWAAEGVAHVQIDARPADERTFDLVLEARERSGVATVPAGSSAS